MGTFELNKISTEVIELSVIEIISIGFGAAFAIEVFVILAIGKVIDTTAKSDTFVNQE